MQTGVLNVNKKAVLWDLDGTIVDSAPYHKLAWRDIFYNRNIDFTEDIYQFTLGRRNDEIIRRYIGPNMSHAEVNVIAEQKEATFRHYIKNAIQPLPFVVEVIKSFAAAEYKLAIVSSATIENILLITETLAIKSFFSLFVTGKDVVLGKPSPQGFLLAAKKLGVESRDCLVIEDAAVGVMAAKRGGMYCIAVTNTCPEQALTEADVVLSSVDKITIS